jgi:hypothetical protein
MTNPASSAASSRIRIIAYWVTTMIIAAELGVGACGTSCEYRTSARSWSSS